MAGYFVFLTLLVVLAVASGRQAQDSDVANLHNALRASSHNAFRGHGRHPVRSMRMAMGHGRGHSSNGHHRRRSGRLGNTADRWASALERNPIARENDEARPGSSHHRQMLEKMSRLFGNRRRGQGQVHGQGHRGGYAHRMLGGLDRRLPFYSQRAHPRFSGDRHRGGNNNNNRHGGRGGHHRRGGRFRHHMTVNPEVRPLGYRRNGRHESGRGSLLGPRYVVTR